MSTVDSAIKVPPQSVYRRKTWLQKAGLAGLTLEVLKYVLLIVLAASYLLPFYWMATSSLKNDDQVYTVPPKWWPNPRLWQNFGDAWSSLDFNLYTFNTIVRYAIPATLGTLLSSVVVAYGFARLKWRGRDVLFAVVLATMMIPFQVRLVPLFVIFKNMGWLNSYKPLVIPAWFANPFFIFMLRQFFRTIPDDLSDAARIDGAGELGILFRIILPLTKPALAVVALFAFIGCWNDYLGPLIYCNKPPDWTLALGVNQLRSRWQEAGTKIMVYPYLMAISTIVTAPVVLLFFFAQRSFIEGITLTGMKG